MDLITHFIVPYAIMTLVKSKHRLEAAFGGISLDFDVLIAWIGILSPELFVFSHRGITHSFLFGFFTSVLFLFVVTRKPVKNLIDRIIHRDLKIEFTKVTVLIVFFGALTHLFLDSLTSLGIPLFYPFTLTRYSAELFYYLDTFTTIIALGVLAIIYLKVNSKYKKIALTSFILMLIIFGGIRAYEKTNALEQSDSLGGNFSYILAYPTTDMFKWSILESNSDNNTFTVFEYDTWNNAASNFGQYQKLKVSNGSYESALNAVNQANTLPEVEKLNWTAYQLCVNADYNSKWNLTYFDIIDSYRSSNLTVTV